MSHLYWEEHEMTNYLSEDFTEEFMKRLNEKEIYLLGAECGAGKTTAILEKLLPFVEKNHQQLLYACNRVALKDQLLNKYKKEIIKEEGIVRQNDNLTLGMYQAITNALIKGTEVIYDETYHYIVLDEAHLIYDAADYDFNAYMFLEFINKLDTIIIMMSGTPESVKKLQPYLKKNLKVLREPDKENNPIRNIYLVEDNNVFEELCQ